MQLMRVIWLKIKNRFLSNKCYIWNLLEAIKDVSIYLRINIIISIEWYH